jgi:hypothetical protein
LKPSAGKYILPQPREAEESGQYVPIPKLKRGAAIPFGYKQSEEDPDQLDPIPEELKALEKAKQYLRQYSSRKVAAWLTKVTGRSISHTGLLQRVKDERRTKQKASTLRSWARRYKKAIELAEKYENRKGKKEYQAARAIIDSVDNRRTGA